MSLLAQRLLMASGGKKDPTYLDDVFSTYLYEGRGTTQAISNGIALSNNNAGFGVEFNSSQTDGIVSSASDGFKFETGDFTVEHWMYTDFAGTQQIIDGRNYGASGDSNWSTSITSSNEYRLFAVEPGTSAEIRITNNTTLNTNTWYHIAIVRSSGTTKMYIDGVQQTQTWSDSNNYTNTTLTLGVHGPNQSSFPFNGKLSNVRVVKGTAVYTSNFTPPTGNLTNISGTELLCCQSSFSPTETTVDTSDLLTAVNTPVVSSGPFSGSDAKGGMVWIKPRGSGYHYIVDSERNNGAGILNPNTNDANANNGNLVSSLNNGGFTLGTLANANTDGDDYVSWTFAKQKGFFDVVTYTGNGNTSQELAHNLGCAPGCIMVKCTSETMSWAVWHTSTGNTKGLYLNGVGPGDTSSGFWNNTSPTSTHFTVSGADPSAFNTNKTNATYVAYLFAGGQSPTDYSTYFDGNGDYLSLASSSDLQLDGDFTIECWFYPQDTGTDRQTIIGANTAWGAGFVELQINNTSAGTNTVSLWDYNSNAGAPIAKSVGLQQNTGQVLRQSWHHIAVVRKSNNIRIYIDGALANYTTDNNSATIDFGLNGTNIGKNVSGHYVNGKISNLRVVKGQAIYESNFVVPQTSLTTTSQGATASNVKLLCCNTSTNTGSTVTPGTITANGNVAANSDNPFIDEKSKIFGEEGDQNIIKCGKYTGKSEGWDGPWVDLGWSPQWILIKRSNGSAGWQLFDTMRGIVTGGNDYYVNPNTDGAEVTTQNRLRIEPFGFRLDENDGDTSTDGGEFIYMAIRAWDGLVSKPAEVGTDVFTMFRGNGSSTIPSFISGWPVDFALIRRPATVQDWFATPRIMGDYYLTTDSTNAEASTTPSFDKDCNFGWAQNSNYNWFYQSWMWRNCSGFQALTYKGNGQAGRKVAHSLGRAPEMIWTKARKPSGAEYQGWVVYHKGMNGGTNPADYRMYLNTSGGESNTGVSLWNSTIPDSRYFTLGTAADTNDDAGNYYEYMCYLFASVDGISKVDFWVGDGTDDRQITLGFQPRFLVVTLSNQGGGYGWQMMDSVRGFISPNNNILRFNNTNVNSNQPTYFTPTATGFTITESAFNGSNQNWIYYAHA